MNTLRHGSVVWSIIWTRWGSKAPGYTRSAKKHSRKLKVVRWPPSSSTKALMPQSSATTPL
ncbi:hypothetical protein BE20_21470 [Sorangium cellulosum]|nr:hypothetical protein BE20_21470 [Sorangium cellulosum]